jgi:hypothetical protein
MKKTADFQAARGSKAGCGFCGGVPRVVKEMRRGGLPAFSCELFDRSVSMKISALRIFRRHRNGLLRIAMFEPPAVDRDKGRYRFSENAFSEVGKREMSGRVDRVLEEIGQSLRPMNDAPRDGRFILAKSVAGFVICRWDGEPATLAGPCWVEAHEADRGYLDRCFAGWIDPSQLKLWDYATLADLVIAFVDDAHATGDTSALAALKRRAGID